MSGVEQTAVVNMDPAATSTSEAPPVATEEPIKASVTPDAVLAPSIQSQPSSATNEVTPPLSTPVNGMKIATQAEINERGPLGLLPDEEEWVKEKMEYALHDFEILSLTIKRYKWQLSQIPKDISRLQSLKEKHTQDPMEFLRQIRTKEFRYPEGQRTLPAPTIEWSKYHYPPANPVVPTKAQHATYLGTGHFPSDGRTGKSNGGSNIVSMSSSTNVRSRAGSPSYDRLQTVKEAARNLGVFVNRHQHLPHGQETNVREMEDVVKNAQNSRPATPEAGIWTREISNSPSVPSRSQDMEGITYTTQLESQTSTPNQPGSIPTPDSIPTHAALPPVPAGDQRPAVVHQTTSNGNTTYSHAPSSNITYNLTPNSNITVNHMSGSIDVQPAKPARDDTKPILYNIPWSDEEQKQLERLLDEYPDEPVAAQRFQKISLAMGTRTPKQVASRVQKYFIKLVKAGLEAPGRMNYSLEPTKPKVKGASPNIKTKKRKEAPAGGDASAAKGKAVARGKKKAKEEGAQPKKPKPKTGVGRISGAQYLHYSAAPSVYMSEEDDEDSVQDMIAVSSTPGSDTGISAHIGVACNSCGVDPILGTRYSCVQCEAIGGVDLCGPCYNTGIYQTNHHLVTHEFNVLESADTVSYPRYHPSSAAFSRGGSPGVGSSRA